jgi:hypothetical protein
VDDKRDAWLAAAFRSAAEDSRPREDCPDPERIWRAVHRELPLAERLTIVDHVAECPTCAEAWRLAHEIAPVKATTADAWLAHDVVAAEATAARKNWFSTLRQSASLQVAAAVVLVAGLVFAIWMLRPTPDPEVRDPGTVVLRSELGERAALPKDDFRLRWSGGPPGSRYDLTVMTRDLAAVRDSSALARRSPRTRRAHGGVPDVRSVGAVMARTSHARRSTMAEHSKAALDFLKALTAYLKWRANGSPSGFTATHVEAYARYIVECGIAADNPLYKPLVDHMAMMERAGPPPDARLPPRK